MRAFGFLAAIGLMMAAAFSSIPAHAGSLTRTFVSSTGVDTNPCTIAQPCATFAAAYAAVQNNGIIAALDPGKYGPMTNITTGVTINGNGWAAITGPANGTAITINAGSGSVALMGLEIDGAGAAADGIDFNSGATLEISNCVVRNFNNNGLFIQPTADAAFKVTNSEFNDNVLQGILIDPRGAGDLVGTIDRVGLYNDQLTALNLFPEHSTGGSVSVTVTNTVASNAINSPPTNGVAFAVQALNGQAVSHLMLVKSVAANSFTGVLASGPNAIAFVSDSTITKNLHGWVANDGTVETFGNNVVIDNAANESAQTPATTK